MEAKSIFGVLLLLTTIAGINALKVGFGEIDYRAYENKKNISITVQLRGRIHGSIPITVQTLTYGQVEKSKWPITGENLPDPAEYEIEGRQDFVNETFKHTFEKSRTEYEFVVRLNDDKIDEEQEGFFVKLEVDESQLHPKDRNRVYYERGIALIRIEDDDEIRLSFSKPSYTVSEDAGMQTNLIAVVKEDIYIQTEKTLEVMVQSFPYTAKRGEDYNMSSMLSITFAPHELIKYIPFEVIKDLVLNETIETFEVVLTVPRETEVYSLGTIEKAVIHIVDDDCEPNQDIYFLIDATSSTYRRHFCRLHYGVELMIAAINPGGDLDGTRMGAIFYPSIRTPCDTKFFDIGTNCSTIIGNFNTMIDGFYHYETDNPYRECLQILGTYPALAISDITRIINQSINDGEPMQRRRIVVVVLTDGNNSGKLDELRQAISVLEELAPGITIIAAGNDNGYQHAPVLQRIFREELTIIANGNENNVVIRRDSLELARGLVEKMRENRAICPKQEMEIISKLRRKNKDLAYCNCIDSHVEKPERLITKQCNDYCKPPLTPENCRAPPTCNMPSSSPIIPSSVRESRESEILAAVEELHDMVMKR